MMAALVDRCREEVVLVRKKTRAASIVCSDPCCGWWWVVKSTGVCSVPKFTDLCISAR